MCAKRQSDTRLMAPLQTIQWTEGPPRNAIRRGELHLWRIRTDASGIQITEGMGLLGERQRTRAAGMRHELYRGRYVRAQAGLRQILSRYLGEPPQAIDFAYGPAGKPAILTGSGSLSFNLTTTGDLALVAVSAGVGPDAEVGVDCEWIRPRHSLLAVAERMFERTIVEAIKAAPEHARTERFYRAWTALEADAKADGRGLFRPRPEWVRPPTVLHCIPESGYLAAVARADLPDVCAWSSFDLPAQR